MIRKALRRWWRATTAIVLVHRLRAAKRDLNDVVEMFALMSGALSAARAGASFPGTYGHWPLRRLEEVWPFALEEVRHQLDVREQAGRRHSVSALYGLHSEGR